MEKARVSFVKFENNDVIATSGSISFLFGPELFDLENGWIQYSETGVWYPTAEPSAPGGPAFAMTDGPFTPLTVGQYYTISKGESHQFMWKNQVGMLMFVEGLKKGKEGIEYTKLTDILSWLGENVE